MKITKKFIWPIVGYIILLTLVILPFIINNNRIIAGGDYDFPDYGIRIQFERDFYLWRDIDGYGGLSIGKFPSIILSFFIYLLSFLLPTTLLQIFLLIFFYSFGFWGMFFLLKKYSKSLFNIIDNELIITTLSIFYCTNLFAFDILKLPIFQFLSIFAFTPLLILLIIKNGTEKKASNLIWYIVILLFNTYSFMNVTNAVIQSLCILAFIIPFIKKDNYKRFFLILIIYYLINITSILEYIILLLYGKENLLGSQSQKLITDTAKSVQANMFNLRNSFGLFPGDLLGQWWNSKGLVDNFIYKSIYSSAIYGFILLIPLFLFILSLLKKEKDKVIIYISYIVLGSFILITTFGFIPLSGVWETLYKLPFFDIFRNSNKFWILLIVSLSISLIPILNKKRFAYLFIGYVLFLNFYSISGNMFNKDNFISIQDNYKIENIENNLKDIDYNSISIVYPAKDFFLFGYRWGYLGWSPLISLQNKLPILHKQGESLSLANKLLYEKFNDENITKLDKEEFIKYRVKYIILHKDINYDVLNYNNNYNSLKNYLDTNFKEIISNENYNIYQIFDEKINIIQSEFLSYSKVNPSKYHIFIENIKNKQDLYFLGSYQSEWKLYLKKNPSDYWCYEENIKGKKNITECNQINKILEGDELKYLYQSAIFDDSHKLYDNYANSWVIDPQYIKENFSKEYYSINPDGSINIELELYFKPQSYFYLGIILSLSTIFICIIYLILFSIIKRNKNGIEVY